MEPAQKPQKQRIHKEINRFDFIIEVKADTLLLQLTCNSDGQVFSTEITSENMPPKLQLYAESPQELFHVLQSLQKQGRITCDDTGSIRITLPEVAGIKSKEITIPLKQHKQDPVDRLERQVLKLNAKQAQQQFKPIECYIDTAVAGIPNGQIDYVFESKTLRNTTGAWSQAVFKNPLPKVGKFSYSFQMSSGSVGHFMAGIVAAASRTAATCYNVNTSLKYIIGTNIHQRATSRNATYPCEIGDVVTVRVDMDNKSVEWLINERFVCSAAILKSIRSQQLYPAVELYNGIIKFK